MKISRTAAFMLFGLAIMSPANAGEREAEEFTMPSGNIKCVHGITDESSGIYCLREKPSVLSLRFVDGNVDWQEAEGDQPFMDNPPVFEYDAIKEYDDMTCSSNRNGIACWKDNKGFRLSRSGVSVFE
jgi:hypothetical protein